MEAVIQLSLADETAMFRRLTMERIIIFCVMMDKAAILILTAVAAVVEILTPTHDIISKNERFTHRSRQTSSTSQHTHHGNQSSNNMNYSYSTNNNRNNITFTSNDLN